MEVVVALRVHPLGPPLSEEEATALLALGPFLDKPVAESPIFIFCATPELSSGWNGNQTGV